MYTSPATLFQHCSHLHLSQPSSNTDDISTHCHPLPILLTFPSPPQHSSNIAYPLQPLLIDYSKCKWLRAGLLPTEVPQSLGGAVGWAKWCCHYPQSSGSGWIIAGSNMPELLQTANLTAWQEEAVTWNWATARWLWTTGVEYISIEYIVRNAWRWSTTCSFHFSFSSIST